MSLPSVARLAEIPDAVCAALREACGEAKYDDELIMSMASLALTAAGSEFLPVVHHVLRKRGDKASTLARLFAYSDAVDRTTAVEVLGAELLDALLEAEVLASDEADDHALRSRFHVRPLDGLWLLADDPAAGRDAVMPPAGTTRQIVMVMPAECGDPALDVGCGPGSLALTAARRGARQVIGTDINARAIGVARFNARLNGLADRAEFIEGDLVEPVEGTCFLRVVAQPPYVVQPPTAEAVTYLHGGPSGEELALRLLAALPRVLAPGGQALVLMEAVVRPEEPLHTRLKPALGDAPVDLLVMAALGPPPAIQVLAYASLEAPGGGAAYRAAAHRYLDHLESIDASDFHHALVVVRRHPAHGPTRPRLAATVPVSALAHGDARALDKFLKAIELAALNDAALARHGVRATRHARWIEERPGPDPDLEPVRWVRFDGGSFGNDCQLTAERYLMALMLDRAPTITAAAEDLATVSEQTPDAARAALLAFAREGLMRGVLEPGSS